MIVHKSVNLSLVNDDSGLLKLLDMCLINEEFKVVTAENGVDALKILEKDKIDLVISELRMDEIDGMTLFAEIQKQQQGILCRSLF